MGFTFIEESKPVQIFWATTEHYIRYKQPLRIVNYVTSQNYTSPIYKMFQIPQIPRNLFALNGIPQESCRL